MRIEQLVLDFLWCITGYHPCITTVRNTFIGCTSFSTYMFFRSQEPGEEVKAEALDMVDKLVWLNSADAPQASPPRKYRKSFPGLPPASSTLANPALQVFEFEDTPVAQRSQSYNDVSLIKEIQAEWKKKTEQCHRALTIKKGKEKETGLLNEGERLSKLLTDDDREKINEPRLLLHAASTKRISAKLQQDKDEACLDATKTKSPATVKNLSTTHSPKTGRTPLLAKSPAVDSVTDEVKRLKGNSGEPGQVADNGLRNVVVDGMQKLSNLSTLSSNEVLEHSRVQEDREEKVLDGAQILTKRRSQGRNRREHIRVPGLWRVLVYNFSFIFYLNNLITVFSVSLCTWDVGHFSC